MKGLVTERVLMQWSMTLESADVAQMEALRRKLRTKGLQRKGSWNVTHQALTSNDVDRS